ncbi:metal-dependent hydrolase [Halobacteriales archaeon QS_5_70_17]|nr:MAG: metal-dependent hydrolase [Halobacteriales archaeon QS_5_70_17]
MYKLGHWGASLLLYAPVAFALAPTRPGLAVAGGVGVLALAQFPDVDHRLPLVVHRGVTHTLLFAALVGVAAWAGALAVEAMLGVGSEYAPFAAFVGAFGICSHLAADVITPMGVPLLWPLSRRRFTLSVVYADNTLANYLLLGAGLTATAAVAVAWPG